MNYYLTKYLHDTGKTAAFLLPILHKILDDGFEESCAGNPKSLIYHEQDLKCGMFKIVLKLLLV
jgi:hypothetical protein